MLEEKLIQLDKGEEHPREIYTEPKESFSAESQIVEIRKDDSISGLALDNLDQVRQALLFYGGNDYRKLCDYTGCNAEQQEKNVEVVVDFFIKRLEFPWKHPDDEYELSCRIAEAGNLCDTHIRAWRQYDKWMLSIHAKGEDRWRASDEVAEKLKLNTFMSAADLDVSFSLVDKYWFNINLKAFIEMLPLSSEAKEIQFRKQTEFGHHKDEVYLESNGARFKIIPSFNLGPYMRNPHEGLSQVRGNHLVGAAWCQNPNYNYADSYENKILVSVPKISLLVYTPETSDDLRRKALNVPENLDIPHHYSEELKYMFDGKIDKHSIQHGVVLNTSSRAYAITSDQRNALIAARDYIAQTLMDRLAK